MIEIVTIIMSAFVAGLFGALKYYSNTLGDHPEEFEIKKFLPIVVLSLVVSMGFTVAYGDAVSSDKIVEFLTANFTLVVFANTIYNIIIKKYPQLLDILS